ncbi:hypothetical protein N9Y90_04270, partial [Flavobacteriales bacterium]|nr:hypothetical protein [Flavobacteriales bacterium]
DDASCTFAAEGFDCDGNCLEGVAVVYSSGSYASENSFTISDCDGNVLAEMTSGSIGFNSCVVLGDNYIIQTVDSYGDGWNGGSLSIGGVTYTQDDANYGWPYTEDATEQTIVGSCGVPGCIDASACNYNVDATFDDGSCTFAVEGLDCDGNCLVANTTPTSINVQEISVNWGSTYTLVGYGGDWSLVDASTDTPVDGVGLNNTSTDDVLLCLADGCYEISGFSGSGSSYAFAYSINGAPLVTAGAGGAVGTDFISIGEAGCVTGCTDELATNYDANAHISDASQCVYPNTVNFSVDMNGVEYSTADYTNVVINGSWNGWSGWGVELTDTDGDGVWTGTGEFDPAVVQFEYVVAVTGPADAYSGWGQQWGNGCEGTNFLVIFEDGVASYDQAPTVGCEAAEPTVFTVDMNCAGVEFTTVHLTGPIWGWVDNILMTDDDGDGIYSITMENLSGDIEYKYMVDYWASQEDLIDDMVAGATCAPVTDYVGYANRITPAGSTTTDTYGSCDACPDVLVGCTDSTAVNYNPEATEDDGSCNYCAVATVTFNVDAGASVSADYDNVVVNGSFAGPWFGWGVTLTDDDGDGIYSGTAEVEAGVQHQYVHALTGAADGWSGWGQIGYAPEECALGIDPVTGDSAPNFYFTVECGENLVLPTVCFASCVECVSAIPGCMDATACNYNAEANQDDGSCTFAAEGFDCDGNCLEGVAVVYSSGSYASENSFTISDCDGNVLAEMTSGSIGFNSCVVLGDNYIIQTVDSYGDGWNGGSLSIGGVTYTQDDANYGWPYTEDATEQTIVGSCGVPGCIDASACNYNVDATFDDGSCTFAVEGLDCDGNCLVANTTPTSINVQEISVNWGSTYTLVGYGGDWSLVDASTDTPVDGVGLNNTSTDDVLLCLADGCYEISGFSGSGSSYAFAYSINGAPLVTAGAGGAVGTDFISIGEAGCVIGCTDELATNYDANAHITDNTLCEYALVQGCMDVTACNYDPTAEVDFGCEYAEEGYDCDGLCLEDADADGICDADEVLGCTDPTATNYDASATDDDDSCIPCEDISIELSMFDAFGDGWNGATFSMTDGTNTITSDGITEYSGFASEYLCVPAGCYEVTVGGGDTDYEVSFTLGDVIEDAQAGTYSNISVGGDGVVAYCDIVLGCTDSTATNFDATATSDDGNCCYTDVDQDGICDDEEVLGCTDSNADNFNPNAGLDDGSCTFCGDFTAVILATSDATVYGGSDGNVQATGAGGSSNYDVNVFDADGVPQNPFALSAGNYVVQVTDITSSCISEL